MKVSRPHRCKERQVGRQNYRQQGLHYRPSIPYLFLTSLPSAGGKPFTLAAEGLQVFLTQRGLDKCGLEVSILLVNSICRLFSNTCFSRLAVTQAPPLQFKTHPSNLQSVSPRTALLLAMVQCLKM